ncbi:winged helix-turn-helix domain-containing protein [Streptomyces sp. NPDC051582]|uniref:helix-turn-helix domain-containing protein n=1 Tax=Streptomyces TaxID=1883 RepID=UPI0034276F4C
MWDECGPWALGSLPRLRRETLRSVGGGASKGSAAHGWEGQRWTLSRVKTVIGRRFHLACTIKGVRNLLLSYGWFCRVPVRRTMEREDEAVASWVKEVWPYTEGFRP